MRTALSSLLCLALAGVAHAQEVPKTSQSPELEACKATGLLALKERSPTVTDV